MTRPDTDFDNIDAALEQANAALPDVFNTTTTPTTSPVYNAKTEGERWMFWWESHGAKWRFEVNLLTGAIWFLYKDTSDADATWLTLLEHNAN